MKCIITIVDDEGHTLESHTTSHLRPANITFPAPLPDAATKLRLKGFSFTPIVEQIAEPGQLLDIAEQVNAN